MLADNLFVICFTVLGLSVGLMALGFIADGYGKFRAPIRKAEESFDQQAIEGTLGMERIPDGELHQIGNRLVMVKPDPTPDQLEQMRKAFERRTRLYDQTTDTYI